MCNSCVRKEFLNRGTTCYDNGTYYLNFKQCGGCDAKMCLKVADESTRRSDNSTAQETEVEETVTYNHVCSKCGHVVARHAYMFSLYDGTQEFMMNCTLCGMGRDSVAVSGGEAKEGDINGEKQNANTWGGAGTGMHPDSSAVVYNVMDDVSENNHAKSVDDQNASIRREHSDCGHADDTNCPTSTDIGDRQCVVSTNPHLAMREVDLRNRFSSQLQLRTRAQTCRMSVDDDEDEDEDEDEDDFDWGVPG